LEWLNFYDMVGSVQSLNPQLWILRKARATFQQRIQYRDAFRRVDPDLCSSIGGRLPQRLQIYLKDWFCIILRLALLDAVRSFDINWKRFDRGNMFGEWLDLVDAIAYIKDELNEEEFQKAFKSRQAMIHNAQGDYEILEAEMAAYDSQQYDCIQLAFVILEIAIRQSERRYVI
jgi:hypothetical protein